MTDERRRKFYREASQDEWGASLVAGYVKGQRIQWLGYVLREETKKEPPE